MADAQERAQGGASTGGAESERGGAACDGERPSKRPRHAPPAPALRDLGVPDYHCPRQWPDLDLVVEWRRLRTECQSLKNHILRLGPKVGRKLRELNQMALTAKLQHYSYVRFFVGEDDQDLNPWDKKKWAAAWAV